MELEESIKTKAYSEKFCNDCGSTINAKAEICPKCGVRQSPPPYVRSKLAAALFAFFLGGFGVHKFYLGKVGMGIFYLLFCWTAIPALFALIESIILLTMSDETFNEKYGYL